MEKSILTSYEYKCIQDQPAYCVSECPFSVDVKSFMGFIGEKDFEKAFSVLEKNIPLAEITSRLCDQPCEKRCIRVDIDEAVAIGDLEKICVNLKTKRKKRFLPPKNGKKIGIWGSGLSSLVAAFDLILKGYKVTIHEKDTVAGGLLRNISKKVLPESVLKNEIDELIKMGAEFRFSSTMDELISEEKVINYDAVYLGFDSGDEEISSFSSGDKAKKVSEYLQTEDTLIFQGGFGVVKPDEESRYYPVLFAFQGRKAATSIDRVVNKVSISAGRKREGVTETRLSTDISGVEKDGRKNFIDFEGEAISYDIEKAVSEASRCIKCDCSRCLRVCEYLRAFKGHPGKYAREIYNNISIVMGEKKGNLLTNSCSLCGLCEMVCPNDFSMADLTLSARRELYESNKMPQSYHEFALNEFFWASGESCFFALNAPGTDGSEKLFFPGCQLTGSSPGQVKDVYIFLRKNINEKTGFVSGCCGAPLKWAGREDLFKESGEKFKKFWELSGKPEVITACTSCTVMLKDILEGAKITSLYTYLKENMDKLEISDLSHAGFTENLNVIDPCTARNDNEVQKDVREIIKKSGLKTRELSASKENTECCGFGGLVFNANPTLSKDIIELRSKQSSDDFIAYCSMCRDRIASTGKRTFHLLDLLFSPPETIEFRNDPGFSARHDNLAFFKRDMLKEIWGEDGLEYKESAELLISDKVAEILEEQFILKSDIIKVIKEYENRGEFFINPENNSRITSFRPKNVKFWVEFVEQGGKYEILDAWCHRMRVFENNEFTPDKPTPESDVNIICAKCETKLMPSKNKVEYLKSRFDVTLPQCEKCFDVYISKETARGRMAEVEKILEDK